MAKKAKSKFHRYADVQKKRPVKKKRSLAKVPGRTSEKSWLICGFDTSMSSIAGAAIAWDETLKKLRGPKFIMNRWSKDDHYFNRLTEAAKAHEFILGLQDELGISVDAAQVWIAQEEPFPPHGSFTGRGQSVTLKQQAEISGAFLGGLLRWGYIEIWQIGNTTWRKVVADQLNESGITKDLTLHPPKWNDPALALRYNAKPKGCGKWRAKQWAQDVYEPWSVQRTGCEIPDWPDIIESKDGKIPRPGDSKAKGVQPDDRYDALAIMEALRVDLCRLDAERFVR